MYTLVLHITNLKHYLIKSSVYGRSEFIIDYITEVYNIPFAGN